MGEIMNLVIQHNIPLCKKKKHMTYVFWPVLIQIYKSGHTKLYYILDEKRIAEK